MEGCGDAQCSPNVTRGLTLFSCEPRHQRPSSPPLSIPSRRNRSLYIELGARIHNLIGDSQTHHKSAKQSNRLGFQEPKSKKFLTFHPNESSPRTQTDAPNAMARTHKVLKSFSPKFHQSYKSLWGNKRGRTKRGRQQMKTSRSRSTMFPLHKGDMDWWKCRSRSPLSFPSRICKNHWREREEWQALLMENNGGERVRRV